MQLNGCAYTPPLPLVVRRKFLNASGYTQGRRQSSLTINFIGKFFPQNVYEDGKRVAQRSKKNSALQGRYAESCCSHDDMSTR